MQQKPNKVRSEDERRRAERAVVLQVLRDDHGLRWSRAELEDELVCIEVAAVGDALMGLREAGVVRMKDGWVAASAAAWRLGELDLICV